MELFEIVVERQKINQKYILETILEGEPSDYIQEMKELKDMVDDELYTKACLAEGIKSKVNLLINNGNVEVIQDITPLLYNALEVEKPPVLQDIFDRFKEGLLNDIEEYENFVNELNDYEDDYWYLKNQHEDKTTIESNYFRKKVSQLIEGRLKFHLLGSNFLVELTYKDDKKKVPELKTVKDLVKLLTKETEVSFTKNTTKQKLVDALDAEGIKKQVYFNYKNGKEIEFSKKFYFAITKFLGFTSFYAEDFLQLHGLSYVNSMMFDNDIYTAMFEYGLEKTFLDYMMAIRNQERLVASKDVVKKKVEAEAVLSPHEKRKRELIKFKKSFNLQRDYFDMVKMMPALTPSEMDEFDKTLDFLDGILRTFIREQIPKVEKRIKTIENYHKVFTNQDYLKKRIEGASKFLLFELKDVINKTVVDTKWDSIFVIGQESNKILGTEYKDLIVLIEELEDVIFKFNELKKAH